MEARERCQAVYILCMRGMLRRLRRDIQDLIWNETHSPRKAVTAVSGAQGHALSERFHSLAARW